MNSSVSAPTQSQNSRIVIESFEREFAQLGSRNRILLDNLAPAKLYEPAVFPGLVTTSIGELIVRSAAAMEQTCGGLTTNLWDDPFEWTLPETLSTAALISEYLDEVAQSSRSLFARLKHDDDLAKLINLPSGNSQPLVQILLEMLIRAHGYQERAAVIRGMTLTSMPA